MNLPGSLTRRLGPDATRVAVLAALVLFGLLLLFVLASSTRGTYEIRAEFDDVRGLIPGGEIQAGATPVGKVTAVDLNADDEPEVTMEIDDEYQVHEGATADIRLGSNVGAVNRVIELTQGDPTRPELEEGTVLTGSKTDQPVNFDLAVEILDPKTRADLKRFLVGLDEAVEGRGEDFDRTLRHSSEATNEVANLFAQANQDGEALRTLVAEGDTVLSALAAGRDELGESAERMALLLQTTGDRQAELAESTRLLGPSLARGREALDRLALAAPNLRELVSGAGPVTDELGPLARLLPPATDAAGPFLAETRELVLSGPDDLEDFSPVIDAADPVATTLDPVARAALPLGQELRVYTPETIGAFQNFGAAAGTYDAVGHILTTAAGGAQTLPSSTASDTIGPDECTPGLLERPYIRLPGTLECDPWRDFEESFLEVPGEGR